MIKCDESFRSFAQVATIHVVFAKAHLRVAIIFARFRIEKQFVNYFISGKHAEKLLAPEDAMGVEGSATRPAGNTCDQVSAGPQYAVNLACRFHRARGVQGTAVPAQPDVLEHAERCQKLDLGIAERQR